MQLTSRTVKYALDRTQTGAGPSVSLLQRHPFKVNAAMRLAPGEFGMGGGPSPHGLLHHMNNGRHDVLRPLLGGS